MNFWEKIKRFIKRVFGGQSTQAATDFTSSRRASSDTLFSNKDKHITTMLNSISLSSDMKTLYIIDNERAIAYDLTNPKGVVIGLIGDQLAAATAPEVARDQVEKKTTSIKQSTFKVAGNSQYTMSYNAIHKALFIIGVGDIVINLEAPDQAGDCVQQFIDLSERKYVRIRRQKELLEVTYL